MSDLRTLLHQDGLDKFVGPLEEAGYNLSTLLGLTRAEADAACTEVGMGGGFKLRFWKAIQSAAGNGAPADATQAAPSATGSGAPANPNTVALHWFPGVDLVSKTGRVSASAALDKKMVGLYFSAHWCPPCRAFTPVLAQRYTELKAAGKDFEIVFVSSDRDKASCAEYWADMPWL